jgi:translation initiation factor IF-1
MATHQKKHVQKSKFNKELRFRQEKEGEEYGTIIGEKGDARFECKLLDGSIVIAKAKGTLSRGPKKERLVLDDFVLLQLDSCTSTKKYYLVHKYSPDDKKSLKKMGELAQYIDKDDKDKKNDIVFEIEDNNNDAEIDNIVIDDDFIANI